MDATPVRPLFLCASDSNTHAALGAAWFYMKKNQDARIRTSTISTARSLSKLGKDMDWRVVLESEYLTNTVRTWLQACVPPPDKMPFVPPPAIVGYLLNHIEEQRDHLHRCALDAKAAQDARAEDEKKRRRQQMAEQPAFKRVVCLARDMLNLCMETPTHTEALMTELDAFDKDLPSFHLPLEGVCAPRRSIYDDAGRMAAHVLTASILRLEGDPERGASVVGKPSYDVFKLLGMRDSWASILEVTAHSQAASDAPKLVLRLVDALYASAMKAWDELVQREEADLRRENELVEQITRRL
jgi:hypothetical protein